VARCLACQIVEARFEGSVYARISAYTVQVIGRQDHLGGNATNAFDASLI
jgi:hypothetical protein